MSPERWQHIEQVDVNLAPREDASPGKPLPRIALGPVMPGWGSWEWLGEDLGQTLSAWADVSTFGDDPPTDVDLVLVIKHPLPDWYWQRKSPHTRVVYCPVDCFGSAEQIAANGWWLQRCARIIVHGRRLTPFFERWAPVTEMDHHLRFVNHEHARYEPDRPLLWVGVRSNLPPLAEWLQTHVLPRDLIVLTNPERPADLAHPELFGLPRRSGLRLEPWTPGRHRELLGDVAGALDVKGSDFRSRHKPATKATDFIASGIPLALNQDGSSFEQLAAWGFQSATLDQTERWLSRDYWDETQEFGKWLRETLARERTAVRLRAILTEVVAKSTPSPVRDQPSVSDLRAQAEECVRRRNWNDAIGIYRRLANAGSDVQQQSVWRNNISLLEEVAGSAEPQDQPATVSSLELPVTIRVGPTTSSSGSRAGRQRIAIVSLLFNWPSTGGGTVHTAELGCFLERAGYDVQHIFARYAGWGIGAVTEGYKVPHVPLDFDDVGWSADEIQRRFREAVDDFQPDAVIITDSWNFKPLLATAVRGYPYFLRLAAQETLCPLNNVRMLCDSSGRIVTCPLHQLSHADECQTCVARNESFSGALHQAERALSGYGTEPYDRLLRRSYADAAGILVVNPQIAAMVRPFSRYVHVIPSGFDPQRFPWRIPVDRSRAGRLRLVFAGLVHEYMKGFHVLEAACRHLWKKRRDFELIITADAPEIPAPFARYIGWQSQADLPKVLWESDIIVVPTVAEEALGRTAVEGMGAGKPVIASRIGGLPFTVIDDETGLLFEPGNVDELVQQIVRLLDDAELRQRLGDAGRKQFEQEFTWPSLIERTYRPLFDQLRTDDRSAENYRTIPHESISAWRPTLNWSGARDEEQLLDEVSDFFGQSRSSIRPMWQTYCRFDAAEDYTSRFGEWKTLAREEAFVLGLILSFWQPQHVIEIGTQTGRSARKILDLMSFLGMRTRISSFDIEPEVIHVRPDEIDLRTEDLTGRFREEILDASPPGLIFLDAHPRALLAEVIRETVEHKGNWLLAIHDCGRGLCNPHMTIAGDDSHVTSQTGIWERHVLAEQFGITDPLSHGLDDLVDESHRLRIFSTRHGLGVIVPRGMLPKSQAGEQGGNSWMDAVASQT